MFLMSSSLLFIVSTRKSILDTITQMRIQKNNFSIITEIVENRLDECFDASVYTKNKIIIFRIIIILKSINLLLFCCIFLVIFVLLYYNIFYQFVIHDLIVSFFVALLAVNLKFAVLWINRNYLLATVVACSQI